jgi:hypothetical protein
LISKIADALGVCYDTDPEVAFAVGGFLAQDNLAGIGQWDMLYRAEADGPVVLIVEVKCENGFPAEQLWYHKSRGAQLYGALLASVVESSNPTIDEEGGPGVKRVASTGLLVTHDRSKFIVLRPRASVDGRSSMTVHTFPCSTSCPFNDSDTFLELRFVYSATKCSSRSRRRPTLGCERKFAMQRRFPQLREAPIPLRFEKARTARYGSKGSETR